MMRASACARIPCTPCRPCRPCMPCICVREAWACLCLHMPAHACTCLHMSAYVCMRNEARRCVHGCGDALRRCALINACACMQTNTCLAACARECSYSCACLDVCATKCMHTRANQGRGCMRVPACLRARTCLRVCAHLYLHAALPRISVIAISRACVLACLRACEPCVLLN
jgi:hypothetical protein